jgi:drug/metabolite transporter (DMT)-like permease
VAAALILALMPGQIQEISKQSLCRGLGLAAVLSGGFIFQTLGLRSTSPSNSAFITSLSVVLVPLLGFLLFRHKPVPQVILGVTLATLGLFLLLVDVGDLRIRTGDFLTFVCAILFGLQILLLSRFLTKIEYAPLLLLQVLGSAVFCTLLVPFVEHPFIYWNFTLVLYLFITGVLATAGAFYVQARAQRLTTPNRAALIFSLEPFFAALFAYWILDHMLSPREWLGGVLVLSGILVSELQLSRRS